MSFFKNLFKRNNKRVYKESDKDVMVSYNPGFLFAMNLPYAKYVKFKEI